jgi:hypothetical protein
MPLRVEMVVLAAQVPAAVVAVLVSQAVVAATAATAWL